MEVSEFQKRHIHIYQNFIQNKDKIISLPIINKRSNYLNNNQEGIHIFSDSTLRIYISFQRKIGTTAQTGHIFSFNKKTGRKKSIQNIYNHPDRTIDFLIETDNNNIDYRNEIKEYINNYINNTSTKTKNKSVITFLFQQKTIGFSVIHKTKNNMYYYTIKNILNTKDILRKQLIFSYNQQQNKKKYQQHIYHIPEIKNIINLYKGNKKQTALNNHISQKILGGLIKTIQEEPLENIFQEFNKQQILQDKLLYTKNITPHSIIQHNKHTFSILIPWYLSKSAEEEFIQESEQQLKATYLLTKHNPFEQKDIFKIEHQPSQQIYSPRNKYKNYYIYHPEKNTYFGKQKKYLTKNILNKVDIILNTIENKIYIGGKKLTSKEIHSQTMTIELLIKLIQQSKQILHNKDLKPSSYTKNKNDMNSKIIIPLKKIIKKKLGKTLELSCMGQLHNFFIEREPSDIKIAVIQQNS